MVTKPSRLRGLDGFVVLLELASSVNCTVGGRCPALQPLGCYRLRVVAAAMFE